MPAAPHPESERRRLAAVRRLRLLGTPAEERFDKIVRSAVTALGGVAGALEIVGHRVVWRKSAHGLGSVDLPRGSSFADQVLTRDEGCALLADAAFDGGRPTGIPAEADAFSFRAGVAVHFEGERVAVLSVADSSPRTITGGEIARLRELASFAEGELPIVALSEAQIQLAAAGDETAMRDRVDRLTGLWNRDAIIELAAREIARVESSGTMTGLVLLELEGERVDGAYAPDGQVGAAMGCAAPLAAARDSTIRAAAARLRACTRPTDALGRHGSASFALVLQNATVEGTARVAERLRVALAGEAGGGIAGGTAGGTASGPVGRFSCATGFAVATDGCEAAHALVHSAEDALQRAKAAPRDRSRPQGLGKLTRVG